MHTFGTIFVLSAALLASAAAADLPTPPNLLVQTSTGLVRGFLDTNTTNVTLSKWYGIRYAADTSGKNRFRPPQPVMPVPGIVDGTAFGPACLQGQADGGNGTSVQSEDCLRVNVVVPPNAKNLPVYVYSHGGGFNGGASSDPKIDGSFLASKDLIFVSYNYRLSLWGYPHSSEIAATGQTQNLGLLDTRAAVEWVHKNIAAFGGDPNKIVLGGESVGAEMTNLYMSAWPQDSLIRGAVMQSGDTAQPMWPIDQQLEIIARNISCPTGPGLLDCLRTKDGFELKNALLATGAQFQPVTDNITIFMDYVKQTKAGHTAKVPLLIGTNKDEGTLIVEGEPTAYEANITDYVKSNNLNFPHASVAPLNALYPVPSKAFPTAYNATAGMWRDAHMLCLAHNLATQRTGALGLPVWRYRFDLVAANLNSRGVRVGAFHGADIRFVMGTWRTIVKSLPFVPATPFEIAVSDLMVEAWTNFIKDPTQGPRISGWKRYDPRDPSSLAILGLSETQATLGNHAAVDYSCSYWNTLLPHYPQTFPECGTWTC